MKSLHLGLGLVLLASPALSQFLEPPPTTADPNTLPECSWWHVAGAGDTCEDLSATWGITVATLAIWNPSLSSGCNFVLGNSYCIEKNYGVPDPEPTPSTTSAAPTPTGNGVATPTPISDGMTKSCSKFHSVAKGDGCASILLQYGISFDQLFSWNPAVGSNCEMLQLGVNYCVALIGGTPSTSTPPTVTTPANGVLTPTPIPSDTVKNCNKFHFVSAGEGCASITTKYGISFKQFYAWNPAVGSNCELLQLSVNYCVGLIGASPVTTAPPTITTPANGVVTPTPIPDTTVKNCNKFHFVASGDGCASIATKYGISFAQFYAWNPAVGSNCELLQLSVNYCVGLIGGSPVSSAPPTTTTAANGIVTPSPIQDKMTRSCNRFHLVVQGDGCSAIGTKYSVSFAQLFSWNPAIGSNCETLQLNNYVCVGIIGGTPITTSKPSSTTSNGNGIVTPTPIREGTTSTCTQFHFVVKDDTCATLGTKYSITFAQILAWNPTVGSACDGMWLNTYVCVKATGGPTTTAKPTTTTKSTSTSTKGNGVTTPTPTQPGMVTSCKSFHKVAKGDGCQAIADRYKITLANFKKWNTGVGTNCELMWLDAYVCIGVL